MIEELKRDDLNCNVFSVYDYDGLSMQELLSQFFTKINETVKQMNDTTTHVNKKIIDFQGVLDWLLEEGLKIEVVNKIEQMYNNGTLATIINETIFTELNNKIDLVNEQLAETMQQATRKRELEDLSPKVLAAIEGGEGTSFNLLTIPQPESVTPDKLAIDYNALQEMYVTEKTRLTGYNTTTLLPTLTSDDNYFVCKIPCPKRGLLKIYRPILTTGQAMMMVKSDGTVYPEYVNRSHTNTVGWTLNGWIEVKEHHYEINVDVLLSLFPDTVQLLFGFNTNDSPNAFIIGEKVTKLSDFKWLAQDIVDPPVNSTYDENNQRLLLPKRMYFVKNEKLPIYKSSIVATSQNNELCKIALVTKDVSNVGIHTINAMPFYRYFYENILVNESEITQDFSFYLRPTTNNQYIYNADLKKVFVDGITKSGTNINLHCIGDSLTAQGIPFNIKSQLQKYGVTTKLIGTNNTHEGNSGKMLKEFIGASSAWIAPHMKLATESDKTNYPNWCFRRTGSTNEKSYATDTNKTGDFYIFDMADYLAKNGFNNPNVVTIGLGTNDESKDWNWTEANFVSALEFMITRIREALPNAKIGYIPPSSRADAPPNNNMMLNNAILIESVINKIETMRQTDNLVDVIPVWVSFNRDFNYPMTTGITIGNSNKREISDHIHMSNEGREEYSLPITNYILNVI